MLVAVDSEIQNSQIADIGIAIRIWPNPYRINYLIT